MSVELRVARLERRTATSDNPLELPIVARFQRWCASLTPVEQWAVFECKLCDPRLLEAEFAKAVPGGDLEAPAEWLEDWRTQRASSWVLDAASLPAEEDAAATADAALRRLPRGFTAWAQIVGEEGLLEARFGRYPREWSLMLKALLLAGLMFPESNLEAVIRGKRRGK
jgi:hypothetical protein